MTSEGGSAGPKRVVVVGASSGLGRLIGIGLARRGAKVALLARRLELLEEATKEAGVGAVAFRCDVTDQSSCQEAVANAARELGGLDAVVYTPGVGHLCRIEEVDQELWMGSFATNVMGASLITAAALPHLVESKGRVVYLSSISASQTPPWPGLGAYIVTKYALERLVEAWRAEHPEITFTRISVGECGVMTEFATAWDQSLFGDMVNLWLSRGYMSGGLLDPEELVEAVSTVVNSRQATSINTVVLGTRPVPA